MKETPDLFLEREELLEYDIKTGNIKVDKQIFDDFVENTYINIRFVEDKEEGIWQFSMVAEDDEGVFMEYLDYINEGFEDGDVVYDEKQDCYICPTCGEYIADRWQIKDLEYPLPKYCSECGTKLHY